MDDVLIGSRVGRLTVLKQVPTPDHVKHNKAQYYLCKCDCGNEKYISKTHIVHQTILSCGCYCREQTAKSNKVNKIKENNIEICGDYSICHCHNGDFIFDTEDIEIINNYHWHINIQSYPVAYIRGSNKKTIYANKCIIKTDLEVDHIDGNPLNNRKNNLRICTQQQNSMNTKIHSNNTSGVSGVHYDKRYNKWVARIGYKNKRINLGRYNTFEEAVKVREEAENKYFGDWSAKKSRNL